MVKPVGEFTARKVANQSDVLIAAAICHADAESREESDSVVNRIFQIGELAERSYVIGMIGENPTCVASYNVDGEMSFFSVDGGLSQQDFASLLSATESFMASDGVKEVVIDRDLLDMPEDQACKELGYEFTEEMEPVQYAKKALVNPVAVG